MSRRAWRLILCEKFIKSTRFERLHFAKQQSRSHGPLNNKQQISKWSIPKQFDVTYQQVSTFASQSEVTCSRDASCASCPSSIFSQLESWICSISFAQLSFLLHFPRILLHREPCRVLYQDLMLPAATELDAFARSRGPLLEQSKGDSADLLQFFRKTWYSSSQSQVCGRGSHHANVLLAADNIVRIADFLHRERKSKAINSFKPFEISRVKLILVS